jgi:putative ATPase
MSSQEELFPPERGGNGPAAPLAERMRPRSLDEVAGPDDLVGPDGLLRKAIADDRIPSLVFWGPPGVGKTTLARIIATLTRSRFVAHSAVVAGIKEVRAVLEDASRLLRAEGRRTILFVDEIHRFNRAQQDAFLPWVESGEIVLIGATTENPSFELNGALLSRLRVVLLPPLSPEQVGGLLDRALADPERGLGNRRLSLSPDAAAAIAAQASGDARRALSILEAIAADLAADGATIGAADVERVARKKILLYDKSGEEHYNLISALHKSMRNSDPDAALYWLARMLEAGEAPLYVARRIVRFAWEDIGLADPRAMRIALDAKETYDFLGSPEGDLALAAAVVWCSLAPKSNSAYVAWGAVRDDVERSPADPVPFAIRNAPTKLMKGLGYGAEYRYAHDEEGKMAAGLSCLPDRLEGKSWYSPDGEGAEKQLLERLEHFRRLRREARRR